MITTYISPSRYVQGAGAIEKIGKYVKPIGSKALIMGGKTALSVAGEKIKANLAESGVSTVAYEIYCGESTNAEMKRLAEIASAKGADIVIGVGGGKALDTAKGVVHYSKLPLVIVPTTASNDAPCSAVSVVYSEGGAVVDLIFLAQNPDLVLVDTLFIANAPARQLVAGMGDALATWFEARSCLESGKIATVAGGRPAAAATALARLCYETLLKHGYAAKMAVEQKVVTPSLEKVVEANILLSGIGFESGGVSAAHGFVEGMTILHEDPKYDLHNLHGEEVAFGILVMLVMEGKTMDEINEVLNFCHTVGLPVCMEDIGVANVTDEDYRRVAEQACTREIIYNMNFEVNPAVVYNALKTAGAIGKAFKDKMAASS